MSTFLKTDIKEEIPDDVIDNFADQKFEGKIVDYQFLVRPKQEQIDTKPNPASLELVGEILDAYGNESESNIDYVSCGTSKSLPTMKIIPNKKTEVLFCKYFDFKTNCILNYPTHANKQTWGKKKDTDGDSKTIKRTRKRLALFCKYCDFKTHHRESFIRHTKVHETPKENLPYGCTLCEFKCLDKSYIPKHMIKKHTERDKSFICNICGHGFTSTINLKKHSVTVHNEKREFDCDLCSYKTFSNHKLNIHKNYVHFKKRRVYKQVVCDMCGIKFTSIANLNIHLLRIHKVDVEIKTFICYTCGKKYMKRFSFIQHVRQHLTHKEKMFCANCDYSTFTKSNLIQHMVKHNKYINMHKCTMCSFETKRPHTLRNHIKTHFKD